MGRIWGESREKQGESREEYRSETLLFPSSLGCAGGIPGLFFIGFTSIYGLFVIFSEIAKELFNLVCNHNQLTINIRCYLSGDIEGIDIPCEDEC